MDENFDRRTTELAWQEFFRRPRFHIFRMAGSCMYYLFNVDKEITHLSLIAEGALPQGYSEMPKPSGKSYASASILPPTYSRIIFISRFFSLFKKTVSEMDKSHSFDYCIENRVARSNCFPTQIFFNSGSTGNLGDCNGVGCND
ncbi:MAG: hypothetical protein IPN96_20995 [Anaerolineales bacterium]|nr:hypothetical protein [Anaerolineales bacterium]